MPQHTEELSVSNAARKAHEIAARGCGYDPQLGRVTAQQQQQFHAVYEDVLGELMTALDPEAL